MKKITVQILIFFVFFFTILFFWRDAQSTRYYDQKQEVISVLTYNVYGYRRIHHARINALINILKYRNADIVALQEVRPWFLRRLFRNKWVKERYYYVPLRTRGDPKGGLYTLSRFPITKAINRQQPGRINKRVLISYLDIYNEVVPVINVHLECTLDSENTRAKQLEGIFATIKESDNAIILGDFNFGDRAEIEPRSIPEDYNDIWLKLRPAESGYTWDMQRNNLARRNAFKNETSRRIDRILIHSKSWEPISISILGRNPIRLKRGVLYPSDHFGLISVIVKNVDDF
jgi:endonuclease/exonuclease/phosphatase family metal-dependent hydrolase